LLRKVGRLSPDIIHIHGSSSSMSAVLFAALTKRWPVVVTLHDANLFCMTGLRLVGGLSGDVCDRTAGSGCWRTGCWRPSGASKVPVAAAQLVAKGEQRRTWLSATRVIVPSIYLANLARSHGATAEKLAIVPNICPAAHTPVLSAEAYPHVVFVGTLSEEKGADVALEALARLPKREWRATFVGEGPDRQRLEARARELRLMDVEFPGWLHGEPLAQVRERSTVGVFPSRVMESFGLAGVECLAAGRPVVGVARGGASEWLLHEETGLAVAAPDPSVLSQRLAELLFDGVRCRALGERGRRLVAERFSPEIYASQMSTIYEQTLRSDGIVERSCAIGL